MCSGEMPKPGVPQAKEEGSGQPELNQIPLVSCMEPKCPPLEGGRSDLCLKRGQCSFRNYHERHCGSSLPSLGSLALWEGSCHVVRPLKQPVGRSMW